MQKIPHFRNALVQCFGEAAKEESLKIWDFYILKIVLLLFLIPRPWLRLLQRTARAPSLGEKIPRAGNSNPSLSFSFLIPGIGCGVVENRSFEGIQQKKKRIIGINF